MGDEGDPAVAKPKATKSNPVAPPPADAILLTFGEVAYILRVSVPSVRRLVDGGQLATHQVTVGGKQLILREELMDYLRRVRRIVSPPEAVDELARKAEEERAAARRKRLVKADWYTGEDHFAPKSPARGRPKKSS